MRSFKVPYAFAILFGSLPLAAGVHASTPLFHVLYNFCSKGGKFVCSDGKSPAAAIIADSNGDLFGTTSAGGSTGNGVVFELKKTTAGLVYKVIHSFNCADTCAEGGVPTTPLIMDTGGNLYGTAVSGGSDFGGTAFELSPNKRHNAWTYKVLINFCSGDVIVNCVQGMVPDSGLTYAGASSGALYDGVSPLFGTTLESNSSPGIVYELTQSAGNWTGKTIYGFCQQANCTDGTTPVGQIAVDTLGKTLYGTTNGGGNPNGSGVAYRLNIASGTEQVLHQFCSRTDCTDGSGASGGVTLDDGNTLLATSPLGGKRNGGIVFTLDGKTGKQKIVYSFCQETNCADGEGPISALVPKGASFLGTASGGSAFNGVVYRIRPDSSETVIHTFCQAPDCEDGSLPIGAIADRAGNIFGVTERGGERNDGTIYELNAAP